MISPASSSARSASPGTRRVVADERVQVAVAGVEDVGDLQPVLGGELVDPAQHLGQPRARDHAVLDVVGRRDPAHRRERRLARPPDQRPLVLVAGDADLERAGVARTAPRDLLEVARRTRSAGPSSSTSSAAPASSR